MLFLDRKDGGRTLAEKLKKHSRDQGAVVVALPRGGVVVGAEVARVLRLPLDIVVPRKIGAPGNPEFAIGAVTEEGRPHINETAGLYGISEEYIAGQVEKERRESARRLEAYRGDRPPLDLKQKTAILIDDGIATGATMLAAIHSAKSKGAKKIIVAVPVMAADTVPKIADEVDELIFIDAPKYFGAVGAFYQEFGQTTDEDVIKILHLFKA